MAVHEILLVNADIRNMIAKKTTTEQIYDYIKSSGRLKNLQMSLRKLVLERKTSVEEMLKLTYYVE